MYRKMLLAILNYLTNSVKTWITSSIGLIVGQVLPWNTILQRAAWIVAVIAGLLSIINYFFPLRTFYEEYKTRRNERVIDDDDD